jgi:hypothetical protein
MLQVIGCEHCGGSLNKMLHIEVQYKHSFCTSCGADKLENQNNYFCSVKCLTLYLDIHKGFVCKSCRGTGFAWGFQSNGTCHCCNGGIVAI